MSGRASVRSCVRVSFPDNILETVSRIAYTYPLGCLDVPFEGYDPSPKLMASDIVSVRILVNTSLG